MDAVSLSGHLHLIRGRRIFAKNKNPIKLALQGIARLLMLKNQYFSPTASTKYAFLISIGYQYHGGDQIYA
ncbi:MAG: hypothetical protein HHJ09_00925 [Glaciimonas sp.]|nr:hypothetical protein [Glaciimonas sp.]